MSKGLTHLVSWGHELLGGKIKKGQLVVDLTAGNGYDALMLQRKVSDSGQVIAFDIQPQALAISRQRLLEQGAVVRMRQRSDAPLERLPGVDLVESGHETLQDFLPAAPHAVIANLGYLPGGDQSLVTRSGSTLQALQQACQLLAPGGRLAVVVYIGHPGGGDEGEQVGKFFTELCDATFHVLQLQVPNRPQAPFLLVAEKKQ